MPRLGEDPRDPDTEDRRKDNDLPEQHGEIDADDDIDEVVVDFELYDDDESIIVDFDLDDLRDMEGPDA